MALTLHVDVFAEKLQYDFHTDCAGGGCEHFEIGVH